MKRTISPRAIFSSVAFTFTLGRPFFISLKYTEHTGQVCDIRRQEGFYGFAVFLGGKVNHHLVLLYQFPVQKVTPVLIQLVIPS